MKIETGNGTDTPSPYAGGEIRSDKAGNLAFVAIAGNGGALKNGREALAFAVLQRALGVGPQAKWGADNGILAKAVCNNEVAVSAVNASYSDAGILGALIAGPGDNIGKSVEAVAKALRGSVTDADVTRGKNQLKAALLLENESGTKAIENIGLQAALLGCARPVKDIIPEIDSVSTADVNAVSFLVTKYVVLPNEL